MAVVQLDKVTKMFDEVRAVEEVSLTSRDGEFVVLVGPSGCGKTTTMRMIAGLESISSGAIYIGGGDVTMEPPKARNVAMVFQSYALYPHLSVFDNIGFGLKIRKLPAEAIKHKVTAVAEMLGIRQLLSRKPKELSGGQRQRVALGRAIVREPSVFLMDEPLSNLDAKLRVEMRAEIIKLQRNLGITTFYVTHDQVEALTMGQRIVVMNEGVVQQIDTPENVYANPTNVFVATFIGSPSMNFREATIQGPNEQLKIGDTMIRVSDALRRKIREIGTREVRVGFRPEHVELNAVADATTGNDNGDLVLAMRGRVEVVENIGNAKIIRLALEDGGTVNALTEADFAGEVDDNVTLSVDVSRMRLFDSQSGEAISVN